MQLDRLEERFNNIQQQHQYDVNSLKQEYQEKAQEKTMELERLEERVNDIQQQYQYDVNFLKQEYQEKVRILQNQLEQKVNTTQTKLEQKFFVCFLLSLVCLMLYLTKLEDGVQKNLEEKVDSLNTNITSYLTKLEDRIENNLKEKVSVIKSQHEKKVSMVKKNLEEKMDSLNTRLRAGEEFRIFTWKITNFAIKLKQVKNKEKQYVISDPFYRNGYKLKLRLYPNGNDIVKNTHLSIYIVVLKGEYDAMLPWPFKKRVKLTLIDQQEDPVQRKNFSMQFIPDNDPDCFERPTREENIGDGFSYFISHEKLYSRRYLVDNTLFLQGEIDSSSS